MLPDALRDRPQWLVSGEDKAPVSPKTGHYADVTDASLYVSYDEAVTYAENHNLSIGFVLTPTDPFTVVDLDTYKAENPEQIERHKKIFEAFPTYAELSRSGGGVHIWCEGSVPRGVKRDEVELYPHSRYMICTGNSVRDVPIVNCQPMLDILFHEMTNSGFTEVELEEIEASVTDQEIFDMALAAVNGEKFDLLCRGEWQGEYPSQSEADFALMNMLCFYSRSNQQCKRLFRYSALGKRAKAHREDYLDRMIRKIRSEAAPPIDFSELTKQLENGKPQTSQDLQQKQPSLPSQEKKNSPPSIATDGRFLYPPGLIGDIARYITESSTRPVVEIGTVAAVGLCAGILGRQFNISGTGLNQYLILLAKTGVGKEGGPAGIERILARVREFAPVVDTFIGPGTFASGQAIIRTLDEQPSFLSILGEFGLTLQMLSDANAAGHTLVMRRVLLDLYTKSGKTSVLYPSAYSDREKNTKTLFAPAMTLFGESTPDTFYAGLSLQHIADGLVPRFLVVEYEGDRPARNRQAFAEPPEGLIKRVTDLVEIALRMQNNQAFQDVELDGDAKRVLGEFDRFCDQHIIDGGNEGIRQLWNRAHLKAIRLAALLAAADRPHLPVVNQAEAEWAVHIVRSDAEKMAARFEAGDIGEGVSKQIADLSRIIEDYLERPIDELRSYGVTKAMKDRRCVPYVYLQRRAVNLSAFRKDRSGASRALRSIIEEMIDTGRLQKVSPAQVKQNFATTQQMYFIREPEV